LITQRNLQYLVILHLKSQIIDQ